MDTAKIIFLIEETIAEAEIMVKNMAKTITLLF